MIIIDNIEQLSEQWFKLRAGNPGASSFDKIVTSTGTPSTQYKKYLYQLTGESILGDKIETYTNSAMQRGTALEPEARELFELITDREVKQVGLCFPDEERKYHASLDGLLDDSGLEIKCPLIQTHIGYLLGDKLPTEYIQQVQGSMLVTGFNSYWFMSYYPGIKPFIVQVERDEKFIFALEKALNDFCMELAILVNKLKAM